MLGQGPTYAARDDDGTDAIIRIEVWLNGLSLFLKVWMFSLPG